VAWGVGCTTTQPLEANAQTTTKVEHFGGRLRAAWRGTSWLKGGLCMHKVGPSGPLFILIPRSDQNSRPPHSHALACSATAAAVSHSTDASDRSEYHHDRCTFGGRRAKLLIMGLWGLPAGICWPSAPLSQAGPVRIAPDLGVLRQMWQELLKLLEADDPWEGSGSDCCLQFLRFVASDSQC